MRNKKSVLKILSVKPDYFRVSTGIACNVFALGAVADFGAKNFKSTTKADARHNV